MSDEGESKAMVEKGGADPSTAAGPACTTSQTKTQSPNEEANNEGLEATPNAATTGKMVEAAQDQSLADTWSEAPAMAAMVIKSVILAQTITAPSVISVSCFFFFNFACFLYCQVVVCCWLICFVNKFRMTMSPVKRWHGTQQSNQSSSLLRGQRQKEMEKEWRRR